MALEIKKLDVNFENIGSEDLSVNPRGIPSETKLQILLNDTFKIHNQFYG